MTTVATPLDLNATFTLQPDFLIAACNLLTQQCHGAQVAAGWWTALGSFPPIKMHHNVGDRLMLIVTEIAEAKEGERKDCMDDKLPDRKMFEVELADAIIRIFDLAGASGIDLGGALAEKMAYNASRLDHTPAHRAAQGGKKS